MPTTSGRSDPECREDPAADTILHASCVAVAGRGVLIRGASGSGKSGLALQLIALGATLVADDRVILKRRGSAVIASAPDRIRGLIEARGIGILNAEVLAEAPVHLIVDLDRHETARLPAPLTEELMGQAVGLLHKTDSPYFSAALMQYLRSGRSNE